MHIYMQKHNDAITTSRHSSLENYTSHFIWKGSKGFERVLLCERWVENWTELQYTDPYSSGHNSVSFSFSGVAQPGPGGPAFARTWFSFQHFSPTDRNFLSPGLYNNLTSTYFLQASQFALNSTFRQSRLSPDIFGRMHLLFTQVHFFFWLLGRGQYVTILEMI